MMCVYHYHICCIYGNNMCYIHLCAPAHSPLLECRKKKGISWSHSWENLSPIAHTCKRVKKCVKLKHSSKFGSERAAKWKQNLLQIHGYGCRAVYRTHTHTHTLKISTNWRISKWKRAYASIHMHLLLICMKHVKWNETYSSWWNISFHIFTFAIHTQCHVIACYCLNLISARMEFHSSGVILRTTTMIIIFAGQKMRQIATKNRAECLLSNDKTSIPMLNIWKTNHLFYSLEYMLGVVAGNFKSISRSNAYIDVCKLPTTEIHRRFK